MIGNTCDLIDDPDPNVPRIWLVYDNWKAKGSQTRGFEVRRWGMQINDVDKQRNNKTENDARLQRERQVRRKTSFGKGGGIHE